MKKIVICGYHGFSNSGDEALLWAMIDIIRKKYTDVHITVLSIHPKSTSELYGVESVYRYNLIKINKLFKEADLFLFGGGSLLQDVTSSRSLYYYLSILKMAQKNKTKIMLYGNGIGPLCRKSNQKKVRNCLSKVDLITLRDDKSRQLLTEIGVYGPKIMTTADPAFSLKADSFPASEELLLNAGVPRNTKYAVIAIRSWKNMDLQFTDKLAEFCDNMNRAHGIVPLFVLMQYGQDVFISKAVLSKMKTTGYIIDRTLTVKEMFSVLSQATVTIGMRLHMLIYSTILGVPVIALSYDPKDTEFMQSVKQPFCVEVDKLEAKELTKMLDSLMDHYEKHKEELKISLKGLCKKAEMNADLAVQLLKEK